jgi:hypothetical protein
LDLLNTTLLPTVNDELIKVLKETFNSTMKKSTTHKSQTPSNTLDLPIFGFTISLNTKEETTTEKQIHATNFGMSIPAFGFNITVDDFRDETVDTTKDESKCYVKDIIYDDFAPIPSNNPCQLCLCNVGKVDCFQKECETPNESVDCQPLPVESGVCCPKYQCLETNNVDFSSKTDDSNSEERNEILETVKTTIMDIFLDTTGLFQEVNMAIKNKSKIDTELFPNLLINIEKSIMGITSEKKEEKNDQRKNPKHVS